MQMIRQNKGKDLDKVPKSKLSQGPYYVSKKYDGHYCTIKYDAKTQEVKMWTSGGKEFYLAAFADYIKAKSLFSFHLEFEFNYGCEGLLGDRGKSAIMTTYRTNFIKGIYTPGDPLFDTFRVLDIIDNQTNYFETRVQLLKVFEGSVWFTPVEQHYCSTLEEAQELAKVWVKLGYEGAMLKSPKHKYQPGKRTNDIIKIKPRKTADLVCIGTHEGEGKYENLIGSLVLQDSQGRTVKAGSGLSDEQRHIEPKWFIGRVIEIEYERIDLTYIQPIIKEVRTDKTVEDID